MLSGLLDSEAAAQTVSFGPMTDFGTGNRSRSVAVGDFNGDGKLDLAVANENSSRAGNDSGTVSILLGTGTGSFGAKTDFSTGRGANSVAVGDFNGDGKLDLAVATDVTVSILRGTGTGTFGAKTDFGAGGASSVAVGDFNGDGKLDLAVANGDNTVSILGGNDTVSILLGTGTGSFGAKADFGTGSNPGSVAVGDFNGDGQLDLAVANYSGAPFRFCWARARAALGRRPTSALALVQAQSQWAISMAMASSIWRWRTLGFISGMSIWVPIRRPSRFCWARARAALGRRLISSRAAVHSQSRCVISMAMASSIWR
jgi:uncharacterized protein (DUF2141 family)